ncbi:MAG: cupin domain-containing protein [Gemmatimonadales bacterium]
MTDAVNPKAVAAALTELWSPRVIAEVDDTFVKVARVHGTLAWHSHEHEDEMFYVLDGELRLELEAGPVILRTGEAYVVPKGVRHNPVAEAPCLLMLIERKTTQHTGDVVVERTRSLADQLRPL